MVLCLSEEEVDILMDPLMVDWFNLIRKKQMYIRKESELVYMWVRGRLCTFFLCFGCIFTSKKAFSTVFVLPRNIKAILLWIIITPSYPELFFSDFPLFEWFLCKIRNKWTVKQNVFAQDFWEFFIRCDVHNQTVVYLFNIINDYTCQGQDSGAGAAATRCGGGTSQAAGEAR